MTATAPTDYEPGYYDILQANVGSGGGVQIVDEIAFSEPDDPFIDPNNECAEDITPLVPINLATASEEICPKDRKNICIDIFIPDSVAGGILLGDGRQSDPNAKFGASHAQIVLYPDIKKFATHVSPTCARMPLPRLGQCSPALAVSTDPTKPSHVAVEFYEDGSIAVSLSLRNSVMQIFPKIYPMGPAIDVAMTLTPNSQGGYGTSGVRNSFPSLDVWHWNAGAHTALVQRNATNPFALIDGFTAPDVWCVP